jgi:hypothetical protein
MSTLAIVLACIAAFAAFYGLARYVKRRRGARRSAGLLRAIEETFPAGKPFDPRRPK